MIEAAAVVEALTTTVVTPPANEAQARELAPLVKADPDAASQSRQSLPLPMRKG